MFRNHWSYFVVGDYTGKKHNATKESVSINRPVAACLAMSSRAFILLCEDFQLYHILYMTICKRCA